MSKYPVENAARLTVKNHLYWYLTISFIVGIGIGYYKQSHRYLKSTGEAEDVVRLLIPESSLPQDLVESFVSETGLDVRIDTYANPAEFDARIQNSVYDIALVGHTQVPQLRAEQKLLHLKHELLHNFDNLSADFKDLPSDRGSQYSIAVYWGVRSPESDRAHLDTNLHPPVYAVEAQVLARDLWLGSTTRKPSSFKKDIIDILGRKQDTALWIQSFVILKNSNKLEACHRFLDYFLEGEVAEELSKLTLNSGTNKWLETAQLDATLKPSHLRKQKLATVTRVTVRSRAFPARN